AFNPTVMPDGNYHVSLPAANVTDAAGNPLAGDFSYGFFVLTGDANHDRTVNTVDFNILATNFSFTGRTFTQGDFNYDGKVDTVDFNLLAGNFSKTLLAPAEPAVNSAPQAPGDSTLIAMG